MLSIRTRHPSTEISLSEQISCKIFISIDHGHDIVTDRDRDNLLHQIFVIFFYILLVLLSVLRIPCTILVDVGILVFTSAMVGNGRIVASVQIFLCI